MLSVVIFGVSMVLLPKGGILMLRFYLEPARSRNITKTRAATGVGPILF